MLLMITVPTVVGVVVMLKNIKRSIYDMMSAPLLLAMMGIFIFRVNTARESLFKTNDANRNLRQGYLQQLAYSHAIIAGLLTVLIILQVLAENTTRATSLHKKNT